MAKAYIKLNAQVNDKNITKIKFIFKDEAGKEYVYSTTEGINEIEVPYSQSFLDWLFGRDLKGVYNHDISKEDLGLDDLSLVSSVDVIFEYQTESGSVVETPVLTTGTTTIPKKTSSGGSSSSSSSSSSGGPQSCVPDCTNKVCGSDGCEGECGSCSVGECVSGNCLITGLNTYYVSVLGSGNHEGTVGNEMNLSEAQTYANVHNNTELTFLLLSGNYGEFREHTNDGEKYLFYRNNWITYKAASGATPVLDSISIQNADKWEPIEDGKSYLIFDGFRILNGISLIRTSYVKIINSNITLNKTNISGYYEPYFVSGSSVINADKTYNITIQDNEISNAYRGISAGQGSNWIIKNNILHHFSEDGLSAPTINNLIIENNYFYDLRRFTTSMNIYGTKTGNFTAGEIVTMSETNATGIVYRYHSSYLQVYPTSQYTFWDAWWANKSRYIIGQASGALINPITDVDPPHCDLFQIHGSSSNIVINNNTLDRNRIGGIGSEGGQGFKLAGSPSNVTFTNNLVIADISLIYASNGLIIQNNTQVGSHGFELRDLESDDVIVEIMANNIFNKLVLIDEPDHILQVVNHSNNIFGNNPNNTGKDYLFYINSSNEITNVNITNIFVDSANGDYHPLMSSLACNSSINPVGVAVGALPCAGEIPTISPITKILNWFQKLLGELTGRDILTGNIVGD